MNQIADSKGPLASQTPGAKEDAQLKCDLNNLSLVATVEWLAILLLMYIFSIGPMYWNWLHAKYLHGSYWVALFYEPLWILGGLIPPFGEWLNWYVRWWNV